MRKLFYFSLLSFFFSCQITKNASLSSDHFTQGVVVSARIEAAQIGIAILKKGGNAFDAMAATELALCVSYPYAGNIGGGGFTVYRLNDGTVGALDYREKAPKKAHEKMYLDEKGDVMEGKSIQGALAVGVPGTLRGIWEMHQKYGKLPWKEVVQPSVELAKNGVVVTQNQKNHLDKYRSSFYSVNHNEILYAQEWQVGDTIKNLTLSKTMEKIATDGAQTLYGGELGEKLVDFIQSQGGIISQEDLVDYQAVWRNPIRFTFRGYAIHSMSPPSSGGVVLAQILKTLEEFPLEELTPNSPDYIHLVAEVSKRAYADRSKFIGDPDFVQNPIDSLLNEDYLKHRMKDFNWEKATPSSMISPGDIKWMESDETTHYSIVDQWGNAVSVTTTLNGAYGSKLFVPELGFFLNNEMDDFSIKPGVPNVYGLIGGVANKIAPQKRMLSSMTPTIVEKEGALKMVIGSPGGSTIITTVLQTLLNVLVYDMNLYDAVAVKRFHHQWLPDELFLEPNGFSENVIDSLKARGHQLREENSSVIGKMNAILVDEEGGFQGQGDIRGDDEAVGY